MGELWELVVIILDSITPKKLKKWFNKQNKIVKYILGPLYYMFLTLIFVLIVFLLVCLFDGGDWIF